mmetsp:Transcript_15635/g.12525  ORF Transcript_15635/g.12525 Transcript_15635/m.12525 type:complete len:91 (+) Transcript_15635:86-358(+)
MARSIGGEATPNAPKENMIPLAQVALTHDQMVIVGGWIREAATGAASTVMPLRSERSVAILAQASCNPGDRRQWRGPSVVKPPRTLPRRT